MKPGPQSPTKNPPLTGTYNINPDLIAPAITDRTKAIIAVSLYGQCANFERINAEAKSQNIAVIEDGAQSFGARRKGKKSSALSLVGCTSFFPSKPLGCYGDGGACFTNDDALAQKMRVIHVHGQDGRYHHPVIGVNSRFDTLQAAVLLSKLKLFPDEVLKRGKRGEKYSKSLKDLVTIPLVDKGNSHVYAQYTIRVKNRERFAEKMKKEGIPTAIHYPIPLHFQPAFADLEYKRGDFPVSEEAAAQVISLPMHPYLTDADQRRVIEAVLNFTRDD